MQNQIKNSTDIIDALLAVHRSFLEHAGCKDVVAHEEKYRFALLALVKMARIECARDMSLDISHVEAIQVASMRH